MDRGVERVAGDQQPARWISFASASSLSRSSGKLVVREAGADPAGVMQAMLRVVIAEMQRAEPGAEAAARRGPAEPR